MKTALCWNRLTRLPADRKTGLMAVKTIEMMTRPRTTGSTPLSPARRRVSQARNHSPSDWATISGGTSTIAAASADAVGSSGASARAMLFLAVARHPAGSAGRHVLDHARSEEHTSELQSQSNLVC